MSGINRTEFMHIRKGLKRTSDKIPGFLTINVHMIILSAFYTALVPIVVVGISAGLVITTMSTHFSK